jgi:hypothetical protein
MYVVHGTVANHLNSRVPTVASMADETLLYFALHFHCSITSGSLASRSVLAGLLPMVCTLTGIPCASSVQLLCDKSTSHRFTDLEFSGLLWACSVVPLLEAERPYVERRATPLPFQLCAEVHLTMYEGLLDARSKEAHDGCVRYIELLLKLPRRDTTDIAYKT